VLFFWSKFLSAPVAAEIFARGWRRLHFLEQVQAVGIGDFITLSHFSEVRSSLLLP